MSEPQPIESAAFNQLVDYLQSVAIALPVAVIDPERMPPVAAAVGAEVLAAEIARLPKQGLLHEHRQYQVYYGTSEQLPQTLHEITRLRELTFRDMQEGSGQAVDTDAFDATYLQLFVWDKEARAIVGGYRLGQTDVLREKYGNTGIYLGIMFDFEEAFYAGAPMLEIGRSFVAPAYQRSHSSLYLLWCGISRYLIANPKYRSVYGVVSMSRLYDSRTIAALRDALLEPEDLVTPKSAYEPDLGEQWREYLAANKPMPMREVSKIVKALENGERDVPVLIRHYHKLGAQFVSAAVDGNFNNTPGLLLYLDVPAIPPKYLKQYFGEGVASYLFYKPTPT